MRQGFVLAILGCWGLSAKAHEYWLDPEKFSGKPGDRLAVRLFVGEGLKADEERPFQGERIVSLTLIEPGGRRDLKGLGVADGKPFLNVTLGQEGGHLLVCERTPATIRLEAAKFTAYLKEDGLESIVAERAKRGESEIEGRERYSRHLKTLVRSGGAKTTGDETFGVIVGQKLEIVPLTDPSKLVPPADCKVRILFDGKPLRDAKVFADNRLGKSIRQVSGARSDGDGVATLRIDGPGLWLIRLVTMRRAPEADPQCDWESYWGAYTFGIEGGM